MLRLQTSVQGARASAELQTASVHIVPICAGFYRNAGTQAGNVSPACCSATRGPHMTAVSAPERPSALPPLDSIRGVLFDIDGTLCDSDPLHYQAFRDILAEKGFNGGAPITREFFDEHISGGHNSVLGRQLWPDWSQEDCDKFCDDKEEMFRNMAGGVLKPVDGLEDFLAWADRRKLRKAAVTNAPRANSVAMLDALGLTDAFEIVVLGEECARPKPHPDPYQVALEALGLSPHEAIVIEDSPSGVAAGAAAGVPVVGMLTSQSPERLRRAGAVQCVRNYRELLALAGDAPKPLVQAA